MASLRERNELTSHSASQSLIRPIMHASKDRTLPHSVRDTSSVDAFLFLRTLNIQDDKSS